MAELVTELGLETFRTYNDGDILLDLGRTRSRMSSRKGASPKLSPFVLADLAQGLARFERLTRRIDVQRPWLSKGADRLDEQTWQSWIRRNLRTSTGRAYFHSVCEAVWAAQPADMSLLHALFYTRSNADLDTLIAADRGAQQDRVVGGAAAVAEAMAAPLGEQVRLGDPVRRITHDDDGVRVLTRSGHQYEGSHAVVTLPPTLAGRLEYSPALPSWRDQFTQRVPAGSVIKCFAVYEEPFWREAGLNGQGVLDAGPVKLTFDNSP